MKIPALEPFPTKDESMNDEFHGLKPFITTARTSRKHLRHVTKAKVTDWTDLPKCLGTKNWYRSSSTFIAG